MHRMGLVLLAAIFLFIISSGREMQVTLAYAAPEIVAPEIVIGLGWLQKAELDPQGPFLATCSDSALHLWHLDGSLASFLPGSEGLPFSGFAWSPNGSMIVVVNALGKVRLVRVPDLLTVAELDYDYGAYPYSRTYWGIDPWPVRWSPDGSMIALGWCAGRVHLFDIANRTHIACFSKTGGQFCVADGGTVDWSADGKRILASGSGDTQVFDASTGKVVYKLPGELAAFSPDGTAIATAANGLLRICSASNGSLIALSAVDVVGTSLAWSPGGDFLALGSSDGRILIWGIESREVVTDISAHSLPVSSLSWRGSRLVSGSKDQTVKLWQVDLGSGSLSLIRRFQGWCSAVKTVYWYPDGDLIIATHEGWGEPVRVFTRGGSEKFRIDLDGLNRFKHAVVSPDARMIATCTEGGEVSIWDAGFGSLVNRIYPRIERASLLQWSPEPSILAVAGLGGVEIWDVLNVGGGPLSSHAVGEDVACLAWSPEGSYLAVGLPSCVQIWDPWRPLLLVSLPAWRNVLSVAWSHDGSKLACLSEFDRETDKEIPAGLCNVWDMIAKIGGLARVVVWEVDMGGGLPSASELGGGLVLRQSELWERSVLRQSELGEGLAVLVLRHSHLSLPGCLSWAPNSTMLAVAAGTLDYGVAGNLEEQRFLAECGVLSFPGAVVWRLDPVAGLDCAVVLAGPSRAANCVSWSSDGSVIAVGSDDGSVSLYSVGPVRISELTLGSGDLAILVLAVMASRWFTETCRSWVTWFLRGWEAGSS